MPRFTSGRGWSRAGGRREDPDQRGDVAELFGPLERVAPGLRHVALLQGTKAYGVHVRPLTVPARENRSEMHEQPNFYWNQERYLRAPQTGKAWHWSILRPVLIVGDLVGSAMNVIPALGVYAAMMRRAGKTSSIIPAASGGWRRRSMPTFWRAPSPGRAKPRQPGTRSSMSPTATCSSGRTYGQPSPMLGFVAGEHAPLALDKEIRPREAEWARSAPSTGSSGSLKEFVGLSFEYADYTMGYGRNTPGPAAIVSTIKVMQAGFHEVMDTEAMFRKCFAEMQAKRLLPPR